MKKKILIVAHFMRMPWEKGNSRFTYLANLIDKEKYDVEIVTSSFLHGSKIQREMNYTEMERLDYKITTIFEPGYKKNVSLTRFYSHYVFGKNLKKYLNGLNKTPDIIYCSVPSLDSGNVVAKFAKKNKIRFIVDVQDLWPESFKMVLNIPFVSDIVFSPMMKKANYIYGQADDIVAVSETYVNRATKVNNKFKNKLSAFLGTDLNYFDECKNKNKVEYNDDVIRIAYIGTLGHSYDIKSTIDALRILKDKGISNLKFIVMGNGPLKKEFEEYAENSKIDYEFTGRLDYDIMVGRLCACDIVVNPIVGKSVASIINKVGDYAASGLPVINTQESDEYKKIVENYNIGFNCINGDAIDMSKKIENLINNKVLRLEMGKNNRILAEEKFDRNKTYKEICKLVEKNDKEN